MPSLAIETSGRIGSVALEHFGKVVAEEQFAHGLMHAAQMLSLIDRLLAVQGWPPRTIENVYVSHGPGSFTGLRIAITMAKTLALAIGAKVVAVPTMQVLANNAPSEASQLIVLLDAKRDQIFTARFLRDTVEKEWKMVEQSRLDSLTAVLGRAQRPVWLLGEGIPYHQKFISADAAEHGIHITPAESWRARAAVVAQLGHAMAQRGEFSDPDRVLPFYIRLPEAEERALNKQLKV